MSFLQPTRLRRTAGRLIRSYIGASGAHGKAVAAADKQLRKDRSLARSQLKEAELGGRLAGLELDHMSWLAGQDAGDFPLTQRKRPREPEPIPPTTRPADPRQDAGRRARALGEG